MKRIETRRRYLETRITHFGSIPSGAIRQYEYAFPNEDDIFECTIEFIFENTGLAALIPGGNGVLFSQLSASLKFGPDEPSIAEVGRTLAFVQEDQKMGSQSAFLIDLKKGFRGFAVKNEFTTPILNSGFIVKQIVTKVEAV